MATGDSTPESRTARSIVIKGCRNGLGIRILGGRNTSEAEADLGVFIKEVVPNSLAYKDGRLLRGDQLLEVNGNSILGVSNERAVQILKASAATDSISLLISRDTTAQSDFRRLCAALPDATPATTAAATTLQGDGVEGESLPPAEIGSPIKVRIRAVVNVVTFETVYFSITVDYS